MPNTFAQRKLAGGTAPDERKGTLGLALERHAADYRFARVKPDPAEYAAQQFLNASALLGDEPPAPALAVGQ